MLRARSALRLIVMTTGAVRMSAHVYPYRDGTPGVSGYRAEVISEVMILESEFVRLAEAIPADRYTWRPAPDVRTIAEVFLHASAANYNLYKLVGTPTPVMVDTKTLAHSTTDKAKVIATLKASYAHAKAAILSIPIRTRKRLSIETEGRLRNGASCFISFSASHSTSVSR